MKTIIESKQCVFVDILLSIRYYTNLDVSNVDDGIRCILMDDSCVNIVFRSRLGATFRKYSYIKLFNLATCFLNMIRDNTHLLGGSIQ